MGKEECAKQTPWRSHPLPEYCEILTETSAWVGSGKHSVDIGYGKKYALESVDSCMQQ